eukprot:5565682-Amphidinium_carterae.1
MAWPSQSNSIVNYLDFVSALSRRCALSLTRIIWLELCLPSSGRATFLRRQKRIPKVAYLHEHVVVFDTAGAEDVGDSDIRLQYHNHASQVRIKAVNAAAKKALQTRAHQQLRLRLLQRTQLN